MTTLAGFKYVAILFVTSLVFFLIGQYIAPMFLAFAAGIFGLGMCLGTWYYVTKLILKGINDYEEIIVKQNQAYVKYLFIVAALILIPWLSAFIVFLTLK